jgi:hypothetical protein
MLHNLFYLPQNAFYFIILSLRANVMFFINCALKYKYRQGWIKVKMVSLAHLHTPYRSYSRTLRHMTALTSVVIGLSIKVASCSVKCNKPHGAESVMRSERSSASEIPRILWSPTTRHCIHNIPPIVHIAFEICTNLKYLEIWHACYTVTNKKLLRNSLCCSTPMKSICSRPATGTVQIKNPPIDSETVML